MVRDGIKGVNYGLATVPETEEQQPATRSLVMMMMIAPCTCSATGIIHGSKLPLRPPTLFFSPRASSPPPEDPSPFPSEPPPRSFKGFGSRPDPPDPKPKSKAPSNNRSPSTTSRRPAPVKPVVAPDLDPDALQTENAFILTLTAIGIVIFVEGITLAASGLLPEEWDAIITKFVYPAFTPTVGLFLAGAVFYGVYKVLQGKPSGDN